MYRIRNFFRKLRRALRWFLFMFKLEPWNEYNQYLSVTSQYLKEMAGEFEQGCITESAPDNAKRMKLCAKMLDYVNEEHYENIALEKAYRDQRPDEDVMDYILNSTMNKGWNLDRIYKEGDQKDNQCLRIACKIIEQDLRGWWM